MTKITRRDAVGTLLVLPALPLLTMAGRAFADEKPITHKVLLQAKGRVVLLNEKGEMTWEVPCSGVAHDIQLLPNGNILTQTGAGNVVEFRKDKNIVWRYDAKPKTGYDGRVEIHGFQRLQRDRTMIAESGNRRIIEVDKDGKILKEVPLTVNNPNSHRDTRLARKLENGRYLVCHEGDGVVREYDDTSKVVWSYALDLNNRPRTPTHEGHGVEVFGAMRLRNGNTLIAGGNNNRVIEVSPEGKVVWSIEHDELPGIRLFWVTTLDVLPNGNIVVGNTHAGPENPYLFEVTRDKKVVWQFKQFETFGNDVAAARIADKAGKLLK
jgi:outer membrane protein assembly factor BamB